MTELWNEAAETLSGEALEARQLEGLKDLLIRVYEESPFYRDRFDAAGLDVYAFDSLEQYADYPFFDKYEERASQARSLEELGHPLGMHLTCDITEVNRMSASSGTTGTPSFQGHTAADRAVIAENTSRVVIRIGLRPGDRVLYAGVLSMWVAGIPVIDGLMTYGVNVIPIGALVGSMKVAEMAQLTHPKAIMCTPSFGLHLIKKTRAESDIDLATLGIEKIVVYGEPGGGVPEIIAELSEGFGGAEVYDTAGGTGCLNPMFVSCEAHDGMHFIAPDHAYIEVLDVDTGELLPLVDGVEGEFVYTSLDREAGPLVRFRDGDRMKVTTEPCVCGRPGWRVKVLGRVDDMLLVKGVNVFPSAVRDVTKRFGGELTGNIRILKYSESPVVEPPLRVRVECVGDPSPEAVADLKARLEDEIQRVLRFRADAELVPEGELNVEYGATGKIKLIQETYGTDDGGDPE